ncbi:MAG TPA: ANTAR domain-containing protein [Bryobacteraceae bacterium]|nr:ANTAR domain-containing protein [Bryobacteraceae bacterium]
MDDAGQATSLAPLALLAMRETGAAGYGLYAYESGGAVPVRLYGCGLPIPAGPQEGLAVARFGLHVENRKLGFVAFVFRALAVPEEANRTLERLARTLESVWSLFVTPQTVIELAKRISRRQAELADLKVAERAQGFLHHGEPGASEIMATHVECVLRARRLEAFLEQCARDLEGQIEERKVIAQAKNLLQAAHGVSEEEAYAQLRLSSRRSRRRIFEVAHQLIRQASI